MQEQLIELPDVEMKPSSSGAQHKQRLFIPGPTDVAAEVLAAQTAPMIGHRSDEFEALFAKCEAQLQRLFETQARVYIVVASGTGLQEAAIRNCVGGRVVCFVNGAFSQRWHDVAVGCDKQVVRVDVEWNTAVKPQTVAQALVAALADGPVDAITVVHNETSTGVTSPIREIAQAIRALPNGQDIMILVDSVSGLAGARIEMDAWDLDMVLASSQKAFALPPGLAFCAVSDRAMAKAKTVPARGYYFDFISLAKSMAKNQTPATPAVSLLFALDRQLDDMLAEGMEHRFTRHLAMRDRTLDWARGQGFDIFAAPGYESPTVTCINNNREIDISAFNKFLRTKGMVISNGYGDLKGKTFRIAHMGDTQMDELEVLYAAMDEFLA